MAQVRGQARDSVTRPRAVLRRNTLLPFNSKSGWDTLNSVETFNSSELPGTVAHYVPPKPADSMKRSSRLSWPFSTKRMSGHHAPLKPIKGCRLSTVLEDPQALNASVPTLGMSHSNASQPSLRVPMNHDQVLSGCPSTIQPVQNHGTARNSYFRANANNRLQRAKSVAAVPSPQYYRPQLRTRSASLCGQTSSTISDVILPPLPLDIERLKGEGALRGELRHIPSKLSISSAGSTDTAILHERLSPAIPPMPKNSTLR